MGGTELTREGRECSHRLFHMLTSFLRNQGEQLALMSCCLETENPEVNVWIVNKGSRNPCSLNWKCTRDGNVVISFFRIESNTKGNFQICWAVFVCIILAVIWYRTVTIYEMLFSLIFFSVDQNTWRWKYCFDKHNLITWKTIQFNLFKCLF